MNLPSYVGFIQFDVKKGDWSANLAQVRKGLAELSPPKGSLLVLPELWSVGFDYKRLHDHAALTKELLVILQEEAGQHDIFLAGSMPEKEQRDDGTVIYNTLYFTGKDGVVGRYRKQHLFAPLAEDQFFSPGDNPYPVNLNGVLAGSLVCFDLRFAELAKVQAGMGASILVVSAQWPAARVPHWRTLLVARAIENQLYVVACNSCGELDGVAFGGHSMIISPTGEIVHEADTSCMAKGTTLDQNVQNELRDRFNTVAPRPYCFEDAEKIKRLPELSEEISIFKNMGRKVVFTNGCFDILHEGHVTYLQEARKQGDLLVVGLNSDISIRSIKGPGRPVNTQESRARVLAALGCVDRIVIFSEDTPLNLITTLLPSVLVKGADWPVDKIVGGPEVIAAGGEVTNIPMVESFSTTGMIEQIKTS